MNETYKGIKFRIRHSLLTLFYRWNSTVCLLRYCIKRTKGLEEYTNLPKHNHLLLNRICEK